MGWRGRRHVRQLPRAPDSLLAASPVNSRPKRTKVLATEPAHEKSSLTFHQRPSAKERLALTLPRMLRAYPGWVAGGSLLVMATSLLLQAGPLLTEFAINRGLTLGHRSLDVVFICGALYLVLAVVNALLQRVQIDVTGKLASRVMHDLRIRVFTHFQRLSLDFFTEEKAGVLMSRMTSDVENLQQLVQDGISSFAAQGLTMIVITVILFWTNVVLATWTVLLVVPLMFVFTLWFHHASEKGYLLSRDRIANVLADLVGVPLRHSRGNREQPPEAKHQESPPRRGCLPRRQSLHGPRERDLRTRHEHDRHFRFGAFARYRREHGARAQTHHRRPGRVLLVSEPVLLTHPAPRPAVQLAPAGSVLGDSASRITCRRHRASTSRATRRRFLPSRAESLSRT